MNWIYLSPHFDDVVLSCGGLIWHQTQAGESVHVWTICAGDPPTGSFSPFADSLHARWNTGREAVTQRRQEDIAACTRISASHRHFPVPDCIYRYSREEAHEHHPDDPGSQPGFLYDSQEAIFGPLHPSEGSLVQELALDLISTLPQDAEVVCPLALGNHVDHQLTRLAVEGLGRPLWYYADYPYVLGLLDKIEVLRDAGWEGFLFSISPTGLEAWQQAVAEYQSQISTFWPDQEAMRVALSAYRQIFGGTVLWKRPHSE